MNKLTKRAATAVLAALLAVPGSGWAAPDGEDAVLTSIPLYEVSTLSGTGELGEADGPNGSAAYRQPVAVQAKADGQLLIADAGNQRIRVVQNGMTDTVAGIEIGVDQYGFLIGSLINGKADEAAFQAPSGLAIDASGRTIIADMNNNAIRSLSADGKVTTIAGNGLIGTADGAGADARFDRPLDVAVTASGVIYVADTLNHTIRRISNGTVTTVNAPSTRVVEYFPGAVEPAGDFADGPIAQAKFNEPSGLALDAEGNLYVSDTGNQRIRYIDFAKGTVTTVAGSSELTYGKTDIYAQGDYKDGKASEALFNAPRGLAVTPDGGLLIADSLNHVIRYLKDGKVVTVAGTATETSKLDGLAPYAGFNVPTDVAWLGNGAFAVADTGNNRIRIVKPYEKPPGLKAGAKIRIVYNKEIVVTDADPVAENGTIFIPIPVISGKLGYTADAGAGNAATLTRGDAAYKVTAGSKTVVYTKKGEPAETIQLPAAPLVINNRLYLPVRFFAEQIDLDVQWLSDVKAVLLRDKLK
ncbi:MAG TPA: stalk domain-containing protein [Paenibacillus sp.]|uniref:NHL domain-containing protein n=1 Tax=Paenibacillus sp. TaxID=58172 RepID=UPI0028D4AB55|nr:stalk domain-containing protein [Paenibacillus sp.]HUC93522.1 stalk domain-containing protein [Paenibacillus sp.]